VVNALPRTGRNIVQFESGTAHGRETEVTTDMKSLGIDRLGIEERLALVDAIWASICADGATFPLAESQRAELDRRFADDEANPDDTLAWEEVRKAAEQRLATK
jgi:putative addiction module component (TIGR02574 family)